MNLSSFSDELIRCGGVASLCKLARPGLDPGLMRRAAGWGAAGGAGAYAGKKLMAAAGAADDPAYNGETLVGSAAKTALGAMLAAGALKALAHIGRR
jgi:hypothetical protein